MVKVQQSGIMELVARRRGGEGGWRYKVWWDGSIKVRGEAIGPDFEYSGLPRIAVEDVDGATGVFSGGQEDSAIAARTVVGAEGNVSAKDCTRAAKEVLEILPTNAIGELWWRSGGSVATRESEG